MKIASNVTELIGNTPLVRLQRLSEGLKAEVVLKLEFYNPAHSVKDRIGLAMINAAEKEGLLTREKTIIEPTSGNTGIALAMVAAARGYKCILTMPDTMSKERRMLLRAYGAELILTPGPDGMGGAIRKAEELVAAEPEKYFLPQQFKNLANPEVHRKTTAEEIWRDTDGKVDILIAGVGTGGTFTGIARFLKEKDPSIECWGVEPPDSIYGGGDGKGEHMVEGIGNAFLPATFERSLADGVFTVPHAESYAMVDTLGRMGLPAGASSGAAVAGAKRLARRLGEGKRVVTLLTDPSERYFSKYAYDGLYEGRPIR